MTPLIDDETFRREYGSYLCRVTAGLMPADGCPGTCRVCATPLDSQSLLCHRCAEADTEVTRMNRAFPLDHLAFLTYAVEGQEPAEPALANSCRERLG
jgi:hypothetical protein